MKNVKLVEESGFADVEMSEGCNLIPLAALTNPKLSTKTARIPMVANAFFAML